MESTPKLAQLAKSSFRHDVLVTTCANGAAALLGLASGIFTARLLGPQGRGEFAAIQLWGNLVGIIATLGLPEALVYFPARKIEHAGRYLGSAVLISSVAALPLFVATYILMPVLLSAQSDNIVSAARWYLLIIPLSAMGGLPAYCLRGLRRFAIWNVFRLAAPIAWVLVLTTAYLLGRSEPQFLAAGSLISIGLINFVLWAFTIRNIADCWIFATEDWRPMLRFGLPSAISATPQMINLRLDQMLMAALLPPGPLGLYVIAVAYSGAIQPLLSAIGAVFFPHIASKPEWDSKVTSFAAVARLTVLLTFLLVFFVALLAPLGVPFLFGKRFLPAVDAAIVLVIAGGVLGVNSVLEEGLRGLGAPTAVMWAEFGGVPITAVSLALLLKPLGIMGAAISSLLGYGTVSVLLIVQAQFLTRRAFSSLFIAGKSELGLLLGQVEAIVGRLRNFSIGSSSALRR